MWPSSQIGTLHWPSRWEAPHQMPAGLCWPPCDKGRTKLWPRPRMHSICILCECLKAQLISLSWFLRTQDGMGLSGRLPGSRAFAVSPQQVAQASHKARLARAAEPVATPTQHVLPGEQMHT